MEFESYGPVDKLYVEPAQINKASKINGWHLLAGFVLVGLIGFIIWKEKSTNPKEN